MFNWLQYLYDWLDSHPALKAQVILPPEPMANNIIPSPPQFSPKIILWSQAIAKWEGSISSLNNPGNLKYSTLTASWGAVRGRTAADGGNFAQFVTPQAGETALCNYLKLACEDELIPYHSPAARTFEGFTKIYAGNPPQNYINQIAKLIGCTLDTDISTFLN